jgi:hypothetical protein
MGSKTPQQSPYIQFLYCRADSVNEAMRQLPEVGSLCKVVESHLSGMVLQVSEIELKVLRPSILDAIFFRKPKWFAKVHYRRPPEVELPFAPPPPRKR